MESERILKAVVYSRVSTEEQANEGYSIEEQERRCRAAIDSKGWRCVGLFSDPGVSGRTMERPGLQDMISWIQAKRCEAVVIYKLDRLSRLQEDTMYIIKKILLANDIVLLSLNETLDTATPWGRAMIGILSAFNEMEVENIRMRTVMGRRAKAEQGGYAGGRPAYGYRVSNGEMVIVPSEARVVREIYEMRAKKMTLWGICQALTKEGHRTKSGKKFSASSVSNILSNMEGYCGVRTFSGFEAMQPPILSYEWLKKIEFIDPNRPFTGRIIPEDVVAEELEEKEETDELEPLE